MARAHSRHGVGAGHRLVVLVAALLFVAFLSPLARADEANGAWQSKSQLVWDQAAQALVRKSFRVWDAHPELDLEFSWEQQAGRADDPDGIVNGIGRLTWRAKGTAPYDRKAIYSEYQGEMRNGRPHGSGTLSVQSGLSYVGHWNDGVMEGRGAIKFPNGDDYQGDFVANAPHGEGRYAAADGSIFDGAFRSGERHGAGTLIMPDGVSYRSTWQDGQETERSRLGADRSDEFQMAQAAPRITLKAYTDRPRNQQFIKEDDAFRSFVYDQEVTPSAIRIRLASKDFLEAWKGNAVIPEKFKFFEDAAQFAPALLVVELVNEATQAIQFVGGYVEVEESYTDLQPFLDYTPPWGGCGDQGAFEPEFELTNYGWGGVKDAKATYGFGRNPAPDANVVADVGSFERTTKVSALDGLRRLGVNVDRLKRGGFKCSSKAQVPACTTQLLTTGILGRIAANNIIRKEATLLIRTSGRLNYNWTDASGASKTRQSPFAAELPLLTFDTGNAAECGAPAPVERDLKPVKFSLDRKNYRIPLGYRGSLAPRQNRRFALTLSADKSSQHFFKIVLELADGRTIATPKFDFNYFLPNMPPPPEDTPDPPEQNPPGR